MSSKVYLTDTSSILESKILGLELSDLQTKSEYVINPRSIGVVDKIIIINLPLKLNFDRLARFNRIISRFPIDCKNYELIPYDERIIDLKLDRQETNLILSKELLSTLDHLDIVLRSKFLWGLNPETNGHLNLVGYLINLYNKI